MKKILFVLFVCAAANVFAQSLPDSVAKPISAVNYIDGEIPGADLDKILDAGLAAPSAKGAQPYKFVVVKNEALLTKAVTEKSLPKGNIAIVVVGVGAASPATALDCGIAAESMNIAAQALGYGSKLYTGMVSEINKAKDSFGIASGDNAVVVVRVGKIKGRADAVSKASVHKTRKDLVSTK